MKPYQVMSAHLRDQPRDIILSICQYGAGKVWEWGAEAGGQLWRVSSDINDNWGGVAGVGFSQHGREAFAGPGRWNDVDMLVVGTVRCWAPPHPSKLTPNEQYTHLSQWAILAAPMFIGCDVTKLDEFTAGLLGNAELIDIHQDALGSQGARVIDRGEIQVYRRMLENGDQVVAIYNLDEVSQPVSVTWKDLGIAGPRKARDVWRQQDLGVSDGWQGEIPRHGVSLMRLSSP